MAQIDEILRAAVERGASDTHFSAEESIWMRLDGDLERFTEKVYANSELEPLLMQILSEKEKERLKANKNIDKSYFIDGLGNFRVNIFYSRRGVGAVVRTLPSKMPSIDQLGLPPVIKHLAALPKGLILVTGPTGSGKSTTLAAIINYMNENFGYHILTAEDPVEFIHPSKKSLVNQREIGQSCPTFADALKYALREDPDVILVGEMRDLETISLAMTAAETGHLVLGTLHTRGAASTMDRIIESFPGVQQAQARAMLADSLQAVISQSLLKKANGKGRVAVYEIMVMNWAISNLVREGKTFQVPSIIQTGKREGMILMEAHARELLAAGEISQEDADALIGQLNRGGPPANKPANSSPPSMTAGGKSESAPPPPMKTAAVAPKMPAPVVAAPAAKAAPGSAPAPTPVVAAAAPVAPVAAVEEVSELDLISLPDEEGFTNLSELEMDVRDVAPPAPPGLGKQPMKFKPLEAVPLPVQTTDAVPAEVPRPAAAAPVVAAPAPVPAPKTASGLPPPPKPPGSAPVAKTGPKPLPLPIKKTG